jgi:uncharacterized protein YbjT (DUF2867 family)
VALSVVGADRLPDSGYMRAKVAQEALIEAGSVPWTIVRATQFFEFLVAIAGGATRDGVVHMSPAHVQPIAAGDVATALVEIALGAPLRTIREIAGPERVGLDVFVTRRLSAQKDPRTVLTDPAAPYFGTLLTNESLTPGASPWIGATSFAEWLRTSAAPAAAGVRR